MNAQKHIQVSSSDNRITTSQRTFSVDEIAQLCGVSLADVHAWIHCGMIRVATVGRRCRVTADEFRAFVHKMGIPIDEDVFEKRE